MLLFIDVCISYVLLGGEFNFHLENAKNADPINMKDMLGNYNLSQHINEPLIEWSHFGLGCDKRHI